MESSQEKENKLFEDHKCNHSYYGQSWKEIDEDAVNSALLTVDQVLDIIRYHGTDIGEHSLMYWNEVKEYLLKLNK